MGLVYGNMILLVCVVIELLYIHFSRKEAVDIREVTANINSGHILLFIFRSQGLVVYHYVWNNFDTGLAISWPEWAVWIFAIVAWDFCYYWSHRLHHYFTVLWYVHQVHHEGENFNLSLGLRNSWYSTITSLPFFLMLAFMGIPLEVFITISAFHYLIQFLNHSRLVGKIPWAGKIFITPSDHRVHHGKNEPYLDKNFGGTFVIWDKIFRTFQPEIRELPVEYGIQDRVKSNSPLVINNRFISGYFFPVKEQKGNGWQYKVPVFYIVSGCLLLFGLLVCYLYSEQILSGTEKLMFFIIIFLGTVANGGLSDGKKWGILLWFLNGLLLGAVYLIAFRQTMLVQVIFMSLLMMHAVLVAVHASVVLKSIGKN